MESGESRSAKYFCHKCNLTVQTTDLCPLCHDGFIEKLNPSISSFADATNEHREDIDSIPAVLRQVSDNFEVIVQGGDSSQGGFSDHRPSSSNRRDASSDAAQGNDRRRARNQNYAGSFEHVFSELLNTMTRPNSGTLDNNAPLFLLSNPPGDYAWGREGLDTIVTQLLNQMDSSGPPPLTSDKIQDIPLVPVSEKQFSESTQCSVCWESFKLSEYVRQLPCEHIYHDICIVPWLQLHGTCPICRKLLCDDNDSRLGFSHTGNLEALFSDVQRFSVLQGGSYRSSRSRRSDTRRRNKRCYRCSEVGHVARNCFNLNPNSHNRQQQWWNTWNTSDPDGGSSGAAAITTSSGASATETTTTTFPYPYVDIDELHGDDNDDEYDHDDDVYSDLDFGYEFGYDCESENSDFDLDVVSFSGGSSSSANYVFGGGGGGHNSRNATWTAATRLAVLANPVETVSGGGGVGSFRRRSNIRCYKCRRFGHFARDCRAAAADSGSGGSSSSRQQQLQQQPKRCDYCSKTNHSSQQCYFMPTGDGISSAQTARSCTASWRRSAPGGSQHQRHQQQSQQVRFRSPPPPSRYVSPPPPASSSSSSSFGHTSRRNPLPVATISSRGTHNQRQQPVCFKCNTAGHIARQCSYRDTRSCWVCGGKGHISRDCFHS